MRMPSLFLQILRPRKVAVVVSRVHGHTAQFPSGFAVPLVQGPLDRHSQSVTVPGTVHRFFGRI